MAGESYAVCQLVVAVPANVDTWNVLIEYLTSLLDALTNTLMIVP